MTNYGLPYTGSKNKLAEKIIKHFPEADTLVDGWTKICAAAGHGVRRYTIERLYTVR